MSTELFIGLISGTSMDGIDAVLVEFDAATCTLRQTHSQPYTNDLAADLAAACTAPSAVDLDLLGTLHIRVAHAFGEAASQLMQAAGIVATDITAIGSHGQTVLHRANAVVPFTLQLGDPGTLAALTRCTVVADFRGTDIALGGQGAPLVPGFHHWAFGHDDETRAVINIGGIANVTLLDPQTGITGYDTGPGNALLDRWCNANKHTPYDENGDWAAGGAVDAALLEQFMSDPYFAKPAPKSTGTEYFNEQWLKNALQRYAAMPQARDVQSTLAELTARTIAVSVSDASAIAICGGGALNADLMQRLGKLLHPHPVTSTLEWGIEPNWVEGVAFAWLARQRLRAQPTNLPSVTGARAEVSLGGVYLPPV